MDFAKFKALTRFEQTLLGLPFVLTGILLPFFDKNFAQSLNFSKLYPLLFVLPAFLSARLSGMAFNQLIDWKIDAQNPRTHGRPLPAKLVTPQQALSVGICFLLLFFLFAFFISPLCFLLSLPAGGLILLYSFMKRLHYSCHLVIGLIHALAPIMAYVAFTQTLTAAPIFIGLGACFSITGIDIIYAIQDMHFDVTTGLQSVPARFGKNRSNFIAKCFHLLSFIAFVGAGYFGHLPFVYYLAPALVSLAFWNFHTRWQTNPMAFLKVGVLVSASVFLSTLLAFLYQL